MTVVHHSTLGGALPKDRLWAFCTRSCAATLGHRYSTLPPGSSLAPAGTLCGIICALHNQVSSEAPFPYVRAEEESDWPSVQGLVTVSQTRREAS